MTSQPQVPTGTLRTTPLVIERAGDPSVFGEATRADARELVSRYPVGQGRSALLPMLHLVQSVQGHVGPDGIAFCAEQLNLTHAQVAAVATFYTMYKRRPTGEYLVSVCTNTLCGLMGGDEIYAALSDSLGVGMNETTEDGRITLEHAECLAACDYAPVVTVNYEFFDNQSVESAQGLVDDLRANKRPLPTRGAPLCSFREIERQIAGFLDERPESLEATASGVPTVAGVRLADGKQPDRPDQPARRPQSVRDELIDAHADAAPDETGEFPLQTQESEREGYPTPAEIDRDSAGASTGDAVDEAEPAADQPQSTRRRRTSARGRQRASTQQPTSANDAPLQTSASDESHPAQPAGHKEEGEA